ncbi:hypothetical protein ZWY2020_043709 [Hordeum vulgare]|nr:hypothetical protein ZWY2020_043709 [Hordeum vulgare]
MGPRPHQPATGVRHQLVRPSVAIFRPGRARPSRTGGATPKSTCFDPATPPPPGVTALLIPLVLPNRDALSCRSGNPGRVQNLRSLANFTAPRRGRERGTAARPARAGGRAGAATNRRRAIQTGGGREGQRGRSWGI